jgi:Replication-relaxation
MTSAALPQSYVEAHAYDGAAIQHDRRDRVTPCAIQPRDLAVAHAVARYKFLTATQLLELWWPGRTAWACQRRLLRLFNAGHLERFRPIARRGSFPWTYHLGQEGHRLLQRAGLVEDGVRYRARAIYDYGHVLHEIQLNAWALACRRALRDAFVSWEGETDISPPPEARKGQLRFDDDWSAEDLIQPQPRLLRPDAILDIAAGSQRAMRTLFVEYDRTRRIDKNYDKLRRYDAFLCWWVRYTSYADGESLPYVVFVCQDEEQREQFVAAGDRELTGHRWHPTVPPERHEYVGRRRILFAVERDAHAGVLEAWRLPAFPPDHPARDDNVRRVALADGGGRAPEANQLRLPGRTDGDGVERERLGIRSMGEHVFPYDTGDQTGATK